MKRLLVVALLFMAGCNRTVTWERVPFAGEGGAGTLGKDDYQEHFYGVMPPAGACPGGVTVFTQTKDVTVVVDTTLDPHADWWGRLTAHGISAAQIKERDCAMAQWYHADRVTLFLPSEERAAEWKKNSGPLDPAAAARAIEKLEAIQKQKKVQ